MPRANPIKQADLSYMLDEWRPGLYYHLIGKAIPGRTLFIDEEDHVFFLKHVVRFKWHSVFQILAYCLCGNHFHLVVRTLDAEAIAAQLALRPASSLNPSDNAFLKGKITYASYLSTVFGGPLSGFARHLNNVHQREGQVFINPSLHGLTDKGELPGVEFSKTLFCYVALNYVKHHIASIDDAYRWSSLHSNQFKSIDRLAVFDHFGGEEAMWRALRDYLIKYGTRFYAFDEERFYQSLQPRRFKEATGCWIDEEWRGGGLLTEW